MARRKSTPKNVTETHPVGVAVGSTAGAAIGAAVGSVAGPLGAGAGAVVGGVAGGLASIAAGEAAAAEEDEYWRRNFASRPYVEAGSSYDAYRPAYRYGWESRARYAGRSFDEAEDELRRDWKEGGPRDMEWERAKHAVRDAWHRVPREQP
jgi:phage tail tape-measure protein